MSSFKKHSVVDILSSDDDDDRFSDARSNHSSSLRVKRLKVDAEEQEDDIADNDGEDLKAEFHDAVDEPKSREDIPLEKMDVPVKGTAELRKGVSSNEPLSSTGKDSVANDSTLLVDPSNPKVEETLSLKMECEEIPIELDDEDDDDEDGAEKGKKEAAEAMEPPEYFHVNSRTIIINKDLVMTCETICEEDDNIFGHSEDLSLTQAKDFEIRQNQHETYKKLLKEKTDNNYNIKHLELTESDSLATLLNPPVSSSTRNAIQVPSSGVPLLVSMPLVSVTSGVSLH